MTNLSTIITPGNVATGDNEITLTNKTLSDPVITYQAGDTSFSVPAGTTAERPAVPSTGELRFNTDVGGLEQYDGTNWVSVVPDDLDVNTLSISGTSITATADDINKLDGFNDIGFRGIPAVGEKTGSYTLSTEDVGKHVAVGSGGSITIPDGVFSAGDAVVLFNNTASDITVTCSIATAYVGGTDSDVASITLSTRGICNVLFISGTVCVITGNVSA